MRLELHISADSFNIYTANSPKLNITKNIAKQLLVSQDVYQLK